MNNKRRARRRVRRHRIEARRRRGRGPAPWHLPHVMDDRAFGEAWLRAALWYRCVYLPMLRRVARARWAELRFQLGRGAYRFAAEAEVLGLTLPDILDTFRRLKKELDEAWPEIGRIRRSLPQPLEETRWQPPRQSTAPTSGPVLFLRSHPSLLGEERYYLDADGGFISPGDPDLHRRLHTIVVSRETEAQIKNQITGSVRWGGKIISD